MMIYRPYKNIQKSANLLNKAHCFRIGIYNTYLLMQYICFKKGWLEGTVPEWVTKNPNFKFYYNKGKPYLKDLMDYHEHCKKNWLKFEGAPNTLIDDFTELYPTIKKECINSESKWPKAKSDQHKALLLSIDHKWYEPKFKRPKKWTI